MNKPNFYMQSEEDEFINSSYFKRVFTLRNEDYSVTVSDEEFEINLSAD